MDHPIKRQSDPQYLHPHFRHKVAMVLEALHQSSIPFEVFEAYRNPELQHKYFTTKIRNHRGKLVRRTKAKPWSSKHQYGVAADFVLRIDGKWSWSTATREHKRWWNELHTVGRMHGLVPLSFEKPHLQLDGFDIKALRAGRYPGGGDDPWAWNLNQAIDRWNAQRLKGAPPYAEYDDLVCRPASDDGLAWKS